MSPQEFSAWLEIVWHCPVDEAGESAEADLAWRFLLAEADKAEVRDGDIQDAAREWASGIRWAAFWISAGACVVAAICNGWKP